MEHTRRTVSNNGSHFVNKAVTQLLQYLGFKMKYHCYYHPQSGGTIEGVNCIQKNKLTKCCEEKKHGPVTVQLLQKWARDN